MAATLLYVPIPKSLRGLCMYEGCCSSSNCKWTITTLTNQRLNDLSETVTLLALCPGLLTPTFDACSINVKVHVQWLTLGHQMDVWRCNTYVEVKLLSEPRNVATTQSLLNAHLWLQLIAHSVNERGVCHSSTHLPHVLVARSLHEATLCSALHHAFRSAFILGHFGPPPANHSCFIGHNQIVNKVGRGNLSGKEVLIGTPSLNLA